MLTTFKTYYHEKHRGKKTLCEADQILFTAATAYIKGVMNGQPTLPVKAWKAEYAKLAAEQIRKGVYSILRQEQREQQPRRAQDMDR